jgi:hypothetical protein
MVSSPWAIGNRKKLAEMLLYVIGRSFDKNTDESKMAKFSVGGRYEIPNPDMLYTWKRFFWGYIVNGF